MTVTTVIETLFTPTAPPDIPAPLLAMILLVAAALAIPRVTWRWFGLFTTLVHELGHAVAALLTGRVVHGIRIRRDHSGEALSSGRGGLAPVVSGFLGYPAPAIVGTVQLWSVVTGYTSLALVVGGGILVLTLVVIRNLFGVLVVVASAGASVALWLFATSEVQVYALLALAIALLVGAVRGLATVIAVHIRHRDRLQSSDAWLLSRRTGIPSAVWLLLFTAVIGGCCALAISLLLELPALSSATATAEQNPAERVLDGVSEERIRP